jgi:HSP20 family protein
MSDSKELQVKDKQEVAAPAEQTRPGVVFTPDVDIFENDQQITLLADMPGVASDDITIDLNDGVLSISGEVKPFEAGDERMC